MDGANDLPWNLKAGEIAPISPTEAYIQMTTGCGVLRYRCSSPTGGRTGGLREVKPLPYSRPDGQQLGAIQGDCH